MKEKVNNIVEYLYVMFLQFKTMLSKVNIRVMVGIVTLALYVSYLSLELITLKHYLYERTELYEQELKNKDKMITMQDELISLNKTFIDYSMKLMGEQKHLINKYKLIGLSLDKDYVVEYMVESQPKMYLELAEEIYDEMVALEEIYDLYPGTLLFIMDVESKFDINAKSNKNAIGLMQIHVPTWTNKLTELGILNKDNHLYNPKANLRAGAYIINHYITRHDGDYRKAFKAYFGGNFESYYDKILRSIGSYYIYLSKSKRISVESDDSTK